MKIKTNNIMNEKDRAVLFELLKTLLEDGLINMGGGEFDFLNSRENINAIITELDCKFNITLRECNRIHIFI